MTVDCEKVTELLSDYIDRRPGLDRGAVESHLARCPRCAEVLEDLKTISRAVGMLSAPEVPEDLWKRAVERAREKAARPRPEGNMRPLRLAFPLAAAAVFALVVWSFPRGRETCDIPPSMGEACLLGTFEREKAEDALVGGSPVEAVRMLEARAELAFYCGGKR